MTSLPLLRPWPALLGVLLCACGTPLDMAETTQLIDHELRWQSQGISHYRFEVRSGTLFDSEPLQWASIEVRNDSLIGGIYLTGDSLSPAALTGRPTVASVFFVLHNLARHSDDDDIRVSFDPDLGYPRRVMFYSGGYTVDNRRLFELRNLVVLD